MTTSKTKRPGRPVGYRAENPASKTLPVRVTEEQLLRYRGAAKNADLSLSDWVRDTLDQAAQSKIK